MDIDEKLKLFVSQHNVSTQIRYGEVLPFFWDGDACMANGNFLAACLCFVTGIEMSLRLPLLFEGGFGLEDGYKKVEQTNVPLLSNDLLLRAQKLGLPVELLRFSHEKDESSFLTKLKSNSPTDKARIIRLRDNICHGNLNLFVQERGGSRGVAGADIETEALELKVVAHNWSKGYGQWHDQPD